MATPRSHSMLRNVPRARRAGLHPSRPAVPELPTPPRQGAFSLVTVIELSLCGIRVVRACGPIGAPPSASPAKLTLGHTALLHQRMVADALLRRPVAE